VGLALGTDASSDFEKAAQSLDLAGNVLQESPAKRPCQGSIPHHTFQEFDLIADWWLRC
jgi:hypothetical protein